MNKVLISLFDLTGNASRPYREDGWRVYQVDKQLGTDILTWDYTIPYKDSIYGQPEVFIIAMVPCTCFAISGNRHKQKRLLNGEFNEAQILVNRVEEIIDYYKPLLKGWVIEQPMTDLHKKNPWVGPVQHKFNPCDYAGYDPEPNNSRYNKQTWLFGKFNVPVPKKLEPLEKDSPIWKNYGGKSLKTKNARSVTPLGFAYAFYYANN